MLNKSTSRSKYVVQSGVTQYPVGFEFFFNGDDTPQIRVTIGAMVAEENLHFVISEDLLTINLIPLEEEAPVDPNDYSWMDKWVGMELVIERDIPFVQESDYQLGRISPERIEKDFDLSVMRDQILAGQIKEHEDDFQGEIDALNSRIDFVQEEHVLDMASVDRVLATKATKTELESAKTTLYVGIEGNAEAIQKTRDDMNAKDSQLETILNDQVERLNTLRTDHDDLGEQVAGIESKIPESASDSNPLVTKETLDGYVKKSGDTMTGDLTFDVVAHGYTVVFQDSYKNVDTGNTDSVIKRISSPHQTQGLIFSETKNGTVDMQFTMVADGFFMPRGNRLLGSVDYPWDNVYAKKLNNGADIAIPTEGGTLARVEDLSGYLPLSGGELTGPITVFSEEGSASDKILRVHVSDKEYFISPYYNGFFFGGGGTFRDAVRPSDIASVDLGTRVFTWRKVYTMKISNGFEDIEVPAKRGTMALVEDIDAIGGEGTTGQVLTKTDDGFAWQDAASGGDYLPLSGGTMTGGIAFTASGTATNAAPAILDQYGNVLVRVGAYGSLVLGRSSQNIIILSRLIPFGSGVSLGDASNIFDGVYTRAISSSNYANRLLVPAEGGTIARIEDIDAAVGDISTALTAILGE